MPQVKIAIIGAGPAGCTLARLLLSTPLPSSVSLNITVYEGESTANARSQGGTLDLHTKTGLLAMQRAGLYDKFLEHARFDGEALQITDKNLRRYINMGGADKGGNKSRGRPEIDRARLRQILVDSLPESMIKWNHRLQSASRSATGQINLQFDNGAVSDLDLVVGADGAWSKIRPLLSDQAPYYSGVSGVRLQVSDVATAHPDLYTLVNRGSLFAYSDHKSLMLQQLGDGSLSASTWVVQPRFADQPLPFKTSDQEALRHHLQSIYARWNPQLTQALDVADELLPMDLYMLPVGHSWPHKSGLTLIGDAAHLMTPFAGQGVNLAMEDSLRLSESIISACNALAASASAPSRDQIQTTLSTRVADFELDMFARASEIQQLTADSMQLMYFEPGAPDQCIERWICGHVGRSVPWVFGLLLKPLVYVYFWLFRLLGWGGGSVAASREKEVVTDG